ncbi:MAG TPA: ABC transporter permease [Gemmatimonadaceae bacterium]
MMRDWPGLRRLFRLPSTPARVRAAVSQELGFHIAGRVEELVASGMSRDEAEREARRRFGDYRRIESEVERLDLGAHRRRSFVDRLDTLAADLRFTTRTLARQPMFAGVVIATLTLGVSGTAAVFHVVDRVVLHPLPYPDPERIVFLGWQWQKGGNSTALSPAKFEFWHDQSQVFEGVATSRDFEARLGDNDAGAKVEGKRITADYLGVLGAKPAIGRAFSPEEFRPDAPPVAILGHALWTSQFGGDTRVVGQAIGLDGRPYTVVGVMPRSFEIAESGSQAQVLVPLVFTPDQRASGGNNYVVVARLKRGISEAQVTADMATVFAGYGATFPELLQKDDRGVLAITYQKLFVGDLSSWLFLMLGATAFVLLLAFANVANLLLARALSRQREFAVRTALGAAQSRIARQVILEMLVLGLVAATLATGVSLLGVRTIVGLADGWMLRETQLAVDPRVVAYTLGVTLAMSVLVGLIIALATTRVDLSRSLSDGRRGASVGRRHRLLRSALVSTEAAIAMPLLAGAGLLIASFAKLTAVDPGFQREGVFTATIGHAPRTYDSAAVMVRFERQVLARLQATPGVISAGSASTLPLQRGWNLPMTVEGRPDATQGNMEWRSVSADYFRAFGVRVIAGRGILESDVASAPPVVVISESFAKRYWPGETPIGQRVHLGQFKGKSIGPQFDEPAREIVGVVPDVRDMSLDQNRKPQTAWVPREQVPRGLASLPSFVVRANDASVAANALRNAIAEADPRVTVPAIASMGDIVTTSLSWRRFTLVLMTAFALLALALTCVGVYGAVAYSVAQRTHEIGIRVALGARPSSVVGLVVSQGVRPAIAGLAIGLAGALGLTRLLTKMLYEIGPRDPLPLGMVALVLVGVAMLASYIPARRAARVDPLTALRSD